MRIHSQTPWKTPHKLQYFSFRHPISISNWNEIKYHTAVNLRKSAIFSWRTFYLFSPILIQSVRCKPQSFLSLSDLNITSPLARWRTYGIRRTQIMDSNHFACNPTLFVAWNGRVLSATTMAIVGKGFPKWIDFRCSWIFLSWSQGVVSTTPEAKEFFGGAKLAEADLFSVITAFSLKRVVECFMVYPW